MGRPLFKFLFVLGVIALIGGAFVALKGKGANKPQIPLSLPIATPPSSYLTNVIAPDGKLTLTMKEERSGQFLKHTFWISSKDGGENLEIFSKEVPSGNNLLIPYNTFSPDDKYIFLKEVTPNGDNFYILSTKGGQMAEGSKAIEVTSLFYNKYTDFKITDITGWGGPTLLVINTDKKTGGQGPSFWFDLSGKTFIRLTNRFN